ncbi:GAF domain-containing protein [Nioella sp. MMSF_3534]|uniref:GAF domain-containing protein n=1 Tax=Nioella sp. MMSF_3534 TaxID=3046720 RepID=UPI00273FC619|nr:GAF domain-containing protein [Nioella sp. MMSF_3534]
MLDHFPPLQRFSEVVRKDQWTSLFPELERLCQDVVGHRLFSCSVFRMNSTEGGVAARIYTSDQKNYPVSGLKTIIPNRWTDIVIMQREVFVANSVEGFSDVFPDHEFIESLGLGSVVNIPVMLRGDFIGTVNMLHEAGFYTRSRLESLERLNLPSLLAFSLSPEAAV